MIQIPQRLSLVTQTAEVLRHELREGRWRQCLPGEHSLSDLLQVSRSTLREALHLLRRERLIRVHPKKRQWVVSRVRPAAKTGSKLVGVLIPDPMYADSPFLLFLFGELRHYLQDAGYQLWIHADSRFRRCDAGKVLQQIVNQTKAACWVLCSPTAQMQRWFSKGECPAIVVGSCYEGIQLPSIDVAYRGVCRHAVGTFLSMRHRRIAFLTRKTRYAGGIESEQGVCEGFEKRSQNNADVMPIIRRHHGTPAHIQATLTSLLQEKSPPTAFLVSAPTDVFTVVTHLLGLGIRIPKDVSLISRDDAPFLANVIPSVARYTFNLSTLTKRLSRMVIQLAGSGNLPVQPVRVMPSFIKGETLNHPPA